jgi:hypothetical protein
MYPLPITAMGVFVIGEFTEDASLLDFSSSLAL